MQAHLAQFAKEENGAVTVDWVVLTAAIVGLGIAVIASVSRGALDHSAGLGAYLDEQDVSSY